jgi:hypothetical protein
LPPPNPSGKDIVGGTIARKYVIEVKQPMAKQFAKPETKAIVTLLAQFGFQIYMGGVLEVISQTAIVVEP